MKSRFPSPLPDGQGALWGGVRAPKEGHLKVAVLTMLQNRPWSDVVDVDRIFTGGVRTAHGSFIEGARTGTEDVGGIVLARARFYAGAHLAIELKRDRYSKLRPEQIERLSAVVASGGVGIEGRDATQIRDTLLRDLGMKLSENQREILVDESILDPPTVYGWRRPVPRCSHCGPVIKTGMHVCPAKDSVMRFPEGAA